MNLSHIFEKIFSHSANFYTLFGFSGLSTTVAVIIENQYIPLFVSLLVLVAAYFLIRKELNNANSKLAAKDKELNREKLISTKIIGCELSEEEREVYENCEKNDDQISVSFADLQNLKSKLSNCSSKLKEKEGKLIPCLNKLNKENKKLLIHICFVNEHRETANSVKESLKIHSYHTTNQILEGLDISNTGYIYDIAISCSYVIMVFEQDRKKIINDTFKARYSNYKKHSVKPDTCFQFLFYSSKGDINAVIKEILGEELDDNNIIGGDISALLQRLKEISPKTTLDNKL